MHRWTPLVLFVSLSVFSLKIKKSLSFSLSLCLSVSLSLCLFVSLSLCLSVSLAISCVSCVQPAGLSLCSGCRITFAMQPTPPRQADSFEFCTFFYLHGGIFAGRQITSRKPSSRGAFNLSHKNKRLWGIISICTRFSYVK